MHTFSHTSIHNLNTNYVKLIITKIILAKLNKLLQWILKKKNHLAFYVFFYAGYLQILSC